MRAIDLNGIASLKVIGLGGVGGFVARALALFLASRDADARLVLVDGDAFEEGNAGRMFFSREGNKAAVVRGDLLPAVRGTHVALTAVEEYVTRENLPRLVRQDDVVALCVDNHATRKLVNDHCARLDDVCLLSAGNDGVEKGRRGTYGNVQLYVRRGGQDLCPPLTQYHPEIMDPEDRSPADAHCTDQLASVPQLLFANLQAAAALCSTLWLHWSGEAHYAELCFDVFDGLMRPTPIPGPR